MISFATTLEIHYIYCLSLQGILSSPFVFMRQLSSALRPKNIVDLYLIAPLDETRVKHEGEVSHVWMLTALHLPEEKRMKSMGGQQVVDWPAQNESVRQPTRYLNGHMP